MQSNGTRGPARRRCRKCKNSFPARALLAGECPLCAGLVALLLRDRRGRFLTANNTETTREEGH